MAQKKFYDELERLKQRLAARETYRTAVPAASPPAALEPYLRKPYGPRLGPPAPLDPALTYPTNNMVRPEDKAEFAARETYRTMIPPPAPPPPLETYLTQPYGPPAALPAAPFATARDLGILAQPNANIYSGNAINRIINRAANVGAPSPLGGTAWDAIKAQMKAPKAEAPNRADDLIDPWSTPDPVAGALGIGVPRETLLGSKSVAAKVPTKGPTKAQQKIIDDAAKNYQSNSMPVLMQPQGPMKGGATMQPSINWGTDATGYGSEDNFGGSAADLLRADELRRKMPGLLGWGGE